MREETALAQVTALRMKMGEMQKRLERMEKDLQKAKRSATDARRSERQQADIITRLSEENHSLKASRDYLMARRNDEEEVARRLRKEVRSLRQDNGSTYEEELRTAASATIAALEAIGPLEDTLRELYVAMLVASDLRKAQEGKS